VLYSGDKKLSPYNAYGVLSIFNTLLIERVSTGKFTLLFVSTHQSATKVQSMHTYIDYFRRLSLLWIIIAAIYLIIVRIICLIEQETHHQDRLTHGKNR